ncbi:MAG: YfiT family bacillithiol transferase [Thermoanaerobaculales bacterium]
MLTDTQRREQIQAIADLPAAVELAVRDLSEEQLDTPYREGGWTVRQVVHHLPDSHMNAYVRMKLAFTEEHPTLKPYDQDAWSRLADVKLPVAPSLALLRALHERWAAFLRSLPAQAWGRRAYHPEHGDMTLDDILASYVHHGANHVGQIEALRTKMKW